MTELADFHTEAFIETARKAIELAAIARFRCPMNGDGAVNSKTVKILCLRGKIRVEISGYNYRTAIILEGPHTGASTMPDPKRACGHGGSWTRKAPAVLGSDGMR